MRRSVIAVPVFAGLAVIGAAACSPDEGDFASEAEEFIEDEDGDVAEQTGLTFTDASCEDPASTDEGTTFSCTATGSDGVAYTFTGEITGSNSFEIGSITPPPGGESTGTTPGGTGTTVAPATTADG